MQFLALLSPAVATAIGWATLGQSLSSVQLAGAAIVIVAVVAGQRVGGPTRDSTSSQFVTNASDQHERVPVERVKRLLMARSREISR
jgi:probable blue pigment (indigoidine) exporter